MNNVISRHRNAKEIRLLRSNGQSLREIADRFGFSRQAIDQILNPLKAAARRGIASAVNGAKISKPKDCQSCGKEGKTEAHHSDYSSPFDVVWLCRECHMKNHPGQTIKKPVGPAMKKLDGMSPTKLKRIRLRLGLSQGQLAKQIGAARQTVNRWERGDGKTMHPVFESQIRELEKERKGAA